MRWWPLAVTLAACGRLPPPPPPEFSASPPGDTYNTRVADLRSTLGRAGIMLRVAGKDVTFAIGDCGVDHQGSCTRCDLAGERTQMDGAVIEAATHAFARYPTEVLERAQIARVSMCRDLVYTKRNTEQIGGLSDYTSHDLLFSVSYFLDGTYTNQGELSIEEIVHHEVFHLLEYAQMREHRIDDPEWQLHNPLGFEYAERNSDEHRRDGFVNAYAASAPHEDRASVYDMMMARSEVLCELAKTDEVIKIKTRIIWRRVLRAVGTDSFIRAGAPCIDWLDF